MAIGEMSSAVGTVQVKGRADGSIFRTQKHPALMQSVLDGTVFTGASAQGTPVTTQAGLSATTPALTLYNPIGSGVNLVLMSANVTVTSSPAAAVGFSLAFNTAAATAPTATTGATLTSNMIGSLAAGAAACYRIATLAAAPVAFRYMGGCTGASAIGGLVIYDKIDGEVVVTPGTAVSIQATSAAAILASMTWKEVPTTAQ